MRLYLPELSAFSKLSSMDASSNGYVLRRLPLWLIKSRKGRPYHYRNS